MLTHLAIKDLAIIEATELSLTEGLNALTGETGAGKSIVIGALNLVLGRRASTGTIRRACARSISWTRTRSPATTAGWIWSCAASSAATVGAGPTSTGRW